MKIRKIRDLWHSITKSKYRLASASALVKAAAVYYAKDIVETIGYIFSVKCSGNSLEIAGAVAPFDGDPVDDFMVYLRGKPLPVAACDKNLPSPDFEKEFPDLRSSDRSGFRIQIRISDCKKIDDYLFFVCPLIKGRPGNVMTGMSLPEGLSLPSQKDIKSIGGNFYIAGMEFLGHLIKYVDLRPDDHILDVGCGVGRLAYPLSLYCSKDSSYEGFDIWDAGISWARNNISSRNPNFGFRKVDVFNKQYNPTGSVRPSEFVFPYQDRSFDVVFLTSVFTHMYAEDARHYLQEIYRVLKPGGRCLLTCWLLNNESSSLMEKGKTHLKFIYKLNECYTADRETPENAIAFDEDLMMKWILQTHFSLRAKHYGYWCGRSRYASYQDIVVIVKK